MTKLYTVVRIGFEYNDEYDSRSDSDFGVPIRAYKSRKKAEDEVRANNEGSYITCCPRHYGLVYRKFYETRQKVFPELASIDYFELDEKWRSLSVELRISIWKECIGDNVGYFYKVVEIEAE